MASTSASSIQKSFKYDVFLSFRGEDTRKNFVDNLYHALKQKGIYTYKDDEKIKKGKRISDELTRSIKDSRFYIIVFSKNYASSSWCLDELVMIMECQKTNEHTAYPVFYDVGPTEVRNQSGVVGEAFAKHEEKEGAGKWRNALREAADLAGWELKNTHDGHEAKFIQKIVEEMSLQLRFIDSSIDEKLVGMETRVKDVVSSLATHINDFRMIGIKGMGGAGKTTLARAVFDQISYRFEGSSFVENVREISKNPQCGLKSLQKQVLSDVLNDKDINVNGVLEGKKLLKQRMRGTKVLVVLDDVDHIDQLEALVGEPNWFLPGSRVIVTTREEQVLVAHKVPKDLILNVTMLSHEEANCLFSKYAFGTLIPIKGYEEKSKQVLCYAAGLPLTIRVLGSFLCGKTELEWADALERLKTIPLKETLEKLELSYNSLEEDYKKMFLDVACILKGWDKEEAIRALECRGFHARNGLRVLEQKSLVTISKRELDLHSWRFNTHSESLDMHDHIEEMGQNIVQRLQPDEPNKHTRLWIKEEINDILTEDKGTEATICIKVLEANPTIVMKGLRKMKNLRFLYVICENKFWRYHPDNADLDYNDTSLYLPDGLQYLGFEGYPFTCLPKYFQANNLVGLKMHSSNLVQLWGPGEERKELKKLRFIDMAGCDLRTLDIGLMPNLETLIVHYCSRLTEFCISVESPNLKHLSLRSYNIKTINLTGANNLETLDLKYEHSIELQMPAENFRLKSLTLNCHKLMTLDFGWAQHLEELFIQYNDDLVELQFPIKNLKYLELKKCKMMKTINLALNQNLKKLKLCECENLLELNMPIDGLELETIEIRYSKLRILNLLQTQHLKRLYLEKCVDLLKLHMPDECPKLETIELYDCYKLRTLNLRGAQNLKRFDLKIEDLEELLMPIESLDLETINVNCCSKLGTLNLLGTCSLKTLDLQKCVDLLELHMPAECLQLKTINVRGCSKLRILNLIGTKNLKRLDLDNCEDLVKLCMPDESLSLKYVSINSCSKLKTLKLGMCSHLEFLHLHDCFTLEEISAPLGCLSGHVRFFMRTIGFYESIFMVSSLPELQLKAMPIGMCPLHPDNIQPKFHFECIYRELTQWDIQNIKKLLFFGLCACTNLASLSGVCRLQVIRKLTLEGSIPEVPKELGELQCLEELSLLFTKIENIPDSICMLEHLKILRIKKCLLLKQLPEDLGRLKRLQDLRVTDCTSLQDIPNSICEMKILKFLYLTDCILVEKLPKEIRRLKRLKELSIAGTGITDLPESIYELTDLRIWQ